MGPCLVATIMASPVTGHKNNIYGFWERVGEAVHGATATKFHHHHSLDFSWDILRDLLPCVDI